MWHTRHKCRHVRRQFSRNENSIHCCSVILPCHRVTALARFITANGHPCRLPWFTITTTQYSPIHTTDDYQWAMCSGASRTPLTPHTHTHVQPTTLLLHGCPLHAQIRIHIDYIVCVCVCAVWLRKFRHFFCWLALWIVEIWMQT